jgi:hypothetical protein
MMSAPSACWTSTAISGERKWVDPSTGDRNSTPVLGDLAKLREAEYLKSAGIGQDGSVPSHEAMQATELANERVSGSEKQVVRVGEHDLGAGRAEIVRPERLHRRVRADRHEDRRLDHAVGGRQSAGAGRAVGREQLELHWINVASP